MAKPTNHRDKWRIRWIDHAGKRQSEVYDRYKDAEQALRRHQIEVHEIRCGERVPVARGKSFNDMCDYWLATRAKEKRSEKDDHSIIRCHLRPAFGGIQLSRLDVSLVDRFKGNQAHLAPHTFANHLTLLISMLNAAVELGWLRKVPRIKKPKIAVAEDYAYLKTTDEIERFLKATDHEDEPVRIMYRLGVYTGMRAGELAGLQWRDVDFPRRIVTVRRSYDRETTKNGRIRRVPILDPVLPVLKAWKLRHPGTWLFTKQRGGVFQPSSRVFQEVLHRVVERAGFESRWVHGKWRWYITFHDLRHTFALHWVMSGGDVFKLQKILGHQSIEMTMRYAHLAPHAFADDYGRLPEMNGQFVSGALGEKAIKPRERRSHV